MIQFLGTNFINALFKTGIVGLGLDSRNFFSPWSSDAGPVHISAEWQYIAELQLMVVQLLRLRARSRA